MLTETDQKKSASYAIEMMLKLSNCFDQMSTICRTAVIEFTRDLHLKQDYQRIAKYRITEEPKREVISRSISEKIEQQMNIVEEIAPKRNIVEKKTLSTALKRPMQLQSISVPPVQKKKQEKPMIASKRQTVQRRSKPKDPILSQKIQPVEEKRVVRQTRRMTPKINLEQNSDLSSEPSDYKSRHKRRSTKGRNKSRKNRQKSRSKKVTDPSKKRPLNGFINFFMEVKDQIKEKYNVSKVPQISHFASVEWKKLSPQQQQKYHNIYYQNVEKMKAAQKSEPIPMQLQQKIEPTKKKEERTFLKVKRPLKQILTEKDQESSSSSGSSSSGSENSDSNDQSSESSSPKQSSEIKKKSKEAVIMKQKETKATKDIKIQPAKQ